MQSIKQFIVLSWAGNLTRIVKRCVCCEQRQRWTASTIQTVFQSTNGRCFYCRRELNIREKPETRMDVDHYWPFSKGGANLLPNLVPSCPRCNRSKGNRLATTFAKKNRSFVKPFCRKLLDGHYCTEQPRHGNKYCFRHQWLHICDNT